MLFFERDIVLYVSTVDTGFTTDNTVKIAVLAGSTLDYKTKTQDTYNYKIEDSPNRIQEKILTGYSAPEFNFVTYAKPYNDTTNDTTVEKLLLYSLMGNIGIEAPTEFTNQFASVNKLPELFLYISFGTNLGYKISNAIVKQAEYKFELNKILQIAWKTVGLKLEKINNTTINLPDTFTDFTSITSYTKSSLASIDLTINYKLAQYNSKMFLDGTDYINKGVGSGTVTNRGTTQTTILDVPAYDTGTSSSLLYNGATFTGNAYPSSGTGDLIVEMAVYWDGTVDGTPQHFFHLEGDYNSGRCYLQHPSILAYFFQLTLSPGQSGSTLPTSALNANAWNYLAFVAYPAGQMYYLFINGEPVSQAWGYSTFINNTTSATTGISIGGRNGYADSFQHGYLAYPTMDWNTNSTKYNMNISNSAGRAVDANTIVKLESDTVDVSTYAHTVVGVNSGKDVGGTEILKTSYPTAASPGQINIDRSAAYNSTDWTIESNFWYHRTGGTYTSGTIWDDGVRRIDYTNNQLYCKINGTTVCRDQTQNTGYYTESFPKATWMHIVFERFNGNYFLYINGILRGADCRKTLTPNTIPSTGTATFLYMGGTSYCYAYNLHVSDIARYSPANITKLEQNAKLDLSELGKIPAINGTLKLKNNVQIVSSDTLDQRTTQHLNHYVKDRETELNFIGYMKTGTHSNIDLFDTINTDIDYNETNIYEIDATLGASAEGKVFVSIPNAQIELPEIKVKDIISSNIKVTSKKLLTNDDDTIIKYTTTSSLPSVFTPNFKPWHPSTYMDYVVVDGAFAFYDMQGTSVGTDSIGGYASSVGGSVTPTYQQSTDTTTPEQYCISVPTDTGNSYIQLLNPNSLNFDSIISTNGMTIEFFWRRNSKSGEGKSTLIILGSGSDNVSFMLRDPFTADDTYRFSEGYNVGTYGPAWNPATNTWYHIVLHITSSQQKLYIDGSLYTTQNNSITIGSNILYLGGVQFVENMSFSHVAVYDFLLAEDRIVYHNSLRNE